MYIMNEKVSIVTVCFNAEKEIEKTIKSVLGQTYQNYEYIIKDGGSEDNTNKIVESYKSKFEDKKIDIKYIANSDKGIYDAMNQSVKYCHGEWVIFMNAGDVFYNNQVLADVFEKNDWRCADVIYGHTLMKLSYNSGIIINHEASQLKKGWSMNHQSTFERLKILKEFPFDIQFKIVADYDHFLKISPNYKFCKCNLIISIMNRDGISNTNIALRNKEDSILNKKYNLCLKEKSWLISVIKEKVRAILPCIEEVFFVKNSMKRIVSFVDGKNN